MICGFWFMVAFRFGLNNLKFEILDLRLNPFEFLHCPLLFNS